MTNQQLIAALSLLEPNDEVLLLISGCRIEIVEVVEDHYFMQTHLIPKHREVKG